MYRVQFFSFLTLCVLGLCQGGVLASEVLKWVDETGRVHYGDGPAMQGKGTVLDISSYDQGTITSSKPLSKDRVVMYSTEWCGYCKQARQYFKDNHISFLEYDIEKNSVARRDYQKLNVRGVPVILLGDKRMNGFSIAGFERLYTPVN